VVRSLRVEKLASGEVSFAIYDFLTFASIFQGEITVSIEGFTGWAWEVIS
jgi:hypothetical protein